MTLLLALAAAACSPAASTPPGTTGPSGSPTGGPTGAPSLRPVTGGVDHPTGAKDVVLRVAESGGFVPVEVSATYAPGFTLYGDGTIVFRDWYAPPPETNDNVGRGVPFQIVRLDEAGIQALLEDAIGRGGLGAAQGPYHGMGADIPTTTFTINAGGRTKEVSVTGLSPDMHPGNELIVTALADLAERLRTFGEAVPGEQPYVAAGYNGVLIPADQPFGPVVAWPWADVQPDDFGGEDEFFLHRAMTPEEVESLGIPNVMGGIMGVALQKDDKLWTFALRPLLPDEVG